MKTNKSLMSSVSTLAMALLFAVTSCQDENPGFSAPPQDASAKGMPLTVRSTVFPVPHFIEDENYNNPVSGDDTPLYTQLEHNAITAPDGHHITLGEFNKVEGTVEIKCLAAGTQIILHLKNLVPKGLYTMWTLTFEEPGFDITFEHEIGEGATGMSNSFKASATGEGHFVAVVPAGALSTFGEIGACALTDEYEVHFVGAYHIDGINHGDVVGPAGSYIEHFAYVIKN